MLRKQLILRFPFFHIAKNIIDRRFYRFKLQNLASQDNRFKFEGVPYTKDEVENSVLCLKSISQDIYLTELISRMYKECYFVGLVRNGFALCEGWGRRGRSTEISGRHYRKIAKTMIEDSKKYDHYIIMKFEDILRDPFGTASKLYEYTELEPTELEKLRLKAKRVLSKEREHKVEFGKEGGKYWFNRDTIRKKLVPNISDIQSQVLPSSDRKIFEREARPILDYFGYE